MIVPTNNMKRTLTILGNALKRKKGDDDKQQEKHQVNTYYCVLCMILYY